MISHKICKRIGSSICHLEIILRELRFTSKYMRFLALIEVSSLQYYYFIVKERYIIVIQLHYFNKEITSDWVIIV